MGRLDKLKKIKTLQNYILKENETNDFISTGCCSLNILFGGGIDKGIPLGKVSMIAADSSLGKSMIGLRLARNAQKKGKSVVLFDAEKAYSTSLAENLGIDSNEILVIQNTSLEEVTTQFMNICDEIKNEGNINDYLFIIDSWNVLVTSKTLEDSLSGKDVQDMTQAKKKNTLAKLLLHSNATIFVINQIYSSMDAYSMDSIPGGKGIYFASSSIVQATSKAKDKNSDGEITGAIITAQTRKGRYSREHSKLKYLINYDGGINPFFGLLDIALEGGYIIKPSAGFYQRTCLENDKKHREKEIYNLEFWKPIFENTDFKTYVEKEFSFKHNEINDENIDF